MTETRERGAGVRLLPSVVTVLALCLGLSSIKFAMDADLGAALAMIGAAAVLDFLDGKIARMLDATSRMGAELDSLSDAISFGVAPAVVLYVTLLEGTSGGWIISLVFAVSVVLRLARFNTLLDDDTMPAYTKDFFVGVPAPAGGLIALTPLAALEQWGQGWWSGFYVVAAWMLISAALVVSRIPTGTLKAVSVPPRMAAALLVAVALVAAALVTFPYVLLMVLVVAYLAHIPFAVRSQRWVAARPEVWEFKPSERRALRRDLKPGYRSVRRLGMRRPRRRNVAGRRGPKAN